MAEATLNIKITKDDAALKELAAQLASVFGGATSEKAKSSAKAMSDAIVAQSKETAKQSESINKASLEKQAQDAIGADQKKQSQIAKSYAELDSQRAKDTAKAITAAQQEYDRKQADIAKGFAAKEAADAKDAERLAKQQQREEEIGLKQVEREKAQQAKKESLANAAAQKAQERKAAADAKATQHSQQQSAEQTEAAITASVTKANEIRAQSEKEYANLKHEYVLKGLDATRQAIHEEEQAIKSSRDAIAKATHEGASKEVTAVLKAERDKQNARLQGLRSVEKEITGARTFTEQLEKNVYGPVTEQSKKGGALSLLLFGAAGAASKAAAEAKEATEKVEALAKESVAKIEELEKKKAAAAKAETQQEIEDQITLTKQQHAEELIRVQQHAESLKKEASDAKAEAEKAKEEQKSEGKKSGGMVGGMVGGMIGGGAIMAGVEGFKMLTEKAEEATDAETKLQTAFGQGAGLAQAKKQAEEIGNQMGVTGDEAGEMLAKVSAASHLTGEKLVEATKSVMAAQQAGLTVTAKSLQSQKGLQTVLQMGGPLVAKAMQAAQSPAKQAQLAMQNVQETLGHLASTILTGLSPIISALNPLLEQTGEIAKDVLMPVMSALHPVFEKIKDVISQVMPPLSQLLNVGFKIMQPILDAVIRSLNVFLVPLQLAGPLLAMLASILQPVSDWMDKNQKLVQLLADAVLFFINPLGGLIALFSTLYDNVKPVHDILDMVWDTIKAGGAAIGAFVSNYVTSLIQAFKDVGKVLNDIIHLNFSGMVEDAKKVGGDVANAYVGSAKKAGASFGKSLAGSMADHMHDAAVENVKKTLDEIDKNLAKAGLTPASKAALEKSRQEWVEYGKKVGADVGEAVQGGMAESAVEPDAKTKKGKKGKSGPSKEEIEKAHAEAALAVQKESNQEQSETDAEHHAAELLLEKQHAEALLAIAKKYHKTKSDADIKAVADAQMAVHAAKDAIQKESQGEDDNAMVAAFQEQQKLNAKAHDLDLANQKQFLQSKLELLKKNGIDTTATEREQAELDLQIADEKYDALEKDLDQNGELFKQLEIQRGQEEAGIHDKFHAAQIDKAKQAADAQKKIQQDQVAFMLGPVSSAFGELTNRAAKSATAFMSSWEKSGNTFKSTAAKIVQGYAQMGLSAVQHASISEIADGAAAAAKWVLGAASSVASALASIPFPFDIIAAGVALAGVVELASQSKKLFPHADGGLVTSPLAVGNHLFGEAGPEAVLPLSSSRAQSSISSALGFKEAVAPLHAELKQINRNSLPPIPLGSSVYRQAYNQSKTLNRGLNVAGRSSMR